MNVVSVGTRHVEGEMSGKPSQGLLPRYGHSLLDEARSEIRNLYVLSTVLHSAVIENFFSIPQYED